MDKNVNHLLDKIFKNNAKDLLNFPVLDFIKTPTYLKEDGIVKFDSKEEAEYFKNRIDIINYDEIANLSSSELNDKIVEIRKQYQKLALKWLESNRSDREKLNKDENCLKDIKNYMTIYSSLLDYINNKSFIDFRMKNIELVYRTQSIPREEQEILETDNYVEKNYCLTEGQVLQLRKIKKG